MVFEEWRAAAAIETAAKGEIELKKYLKSLSQSKEDKAPSR